MFKKLLAILLMLCASMAMAAVDVNKATEAQLDSVKGIGPVTSKLIMSERKKGEFKSWEDFIERVKGVGDDKAAKLSAEGLTVNGAAYKGAAATKKDDKAAAKSEKKETKAAAKDEKKDEKAAAKEEKAVAKAEKKDAKAAADKPTASAKPAASAASAKK
ncbi:ComEA family DNA-binding protein [Caenimonas soli]|uniref:ComEA family DNA-binding protein n=1 Tax=Caenimonas soli TaxID=2735555 RepID=UPI0015559745|nr:helix-hairpin-helix domain-containing protein [Caenimonas soli]NPC55531.1 helix-hairpin-helix domain-containing protein [Caenimonas soli]